MYIRKLQLNSFRNYSLLELSLGQGICIFVGKNAQGKTNLLEACALLSTARSHRTVRDKDMIMHDNEHARARVECVERDGVHTVDIILSRTEKKRISVNGLPCTRIGDMIGQVKTVIFSPEDLDIIKNGPSVRRRFADIDLSQIMPTYFYNLSKYMHVLEQRNQLLKSFFSGKGDSNSLDVFDELLSSAAMPVFKERRNFVKRLSPVCKEVHCSLSGNAEELEVFYVPGCSEETPEKMMETLRNMRQVDIKKGLTSIGPHRDDIGLKLNGVDLRFYGSQGQQRTAALSLKLSQLELMKQDIGESPVLLLDDVMSELDPVRQKYLLKYLKDLQAVITTTHLLPELASIKNAAVFEVSDGKVKW